MNAIEYNANLQAHKECTLYFTYNIISIVYEGQKYSYKEFDEAFKINGISVRPDATFKKGNNPDTTKEWLK